ncbi:tail fiber domain-containing protein [Microbacterium sp. TNHR37B]|uniref:tail fiber domain-containing protein n=1 Tax=Microbacterium sp. TNHR37B TaxID=1775956 RepID=UPI0007B22F52|nr:tail fiber domain-containing protein [Microbacterium sp. TNHR37B]KZE91174.1 hypothetical protein AVP41_00709 [Microbacterium sp. TNHR37B]
MAIGDAAAAAGMAVVDGATTQANTIDTLINQTRDYLAGPYQATSDRLANRHVKRDAFGRARFGPPSDDYDAANKWYVDALINHHDQDAASITSGVFNLARIPTLPWSRISTANAIVYADLNSDLEQRLRYGNFVGIKLSCDSPTSGSHVATKAYVDNNDDSILAIAGAAQDGYLSSAVYSRTISGSYRNVYVKSDGTLGWVSSSRRYKKNIRDWTPDRQAVLAMQLVEFQYKVAVDTDRTGAIEHGLIAEQLDELGLEWLVDYGTDGQPEGVRYDRISLALLSVIQDHETRLTNLETKGA